MRLVQRGGQRPPSAHVHDALVRELREELGVEVRVGPRVGGDWPLKTGYVLRVNRATILDGDPQPLEDHDALRWLEPAAWFDVAWLDADRAVVRRLEEELRA